MKQLAFSVTMCVSIAAIVLFSGQQRRPVVSSQQRQAVSSKQRSATPPRPETIPTQEIPPLFWLPEDMQFPEMPQGSPRTTVLLGNPKAEGLYVTRTLIPKGKQIIPHTHSDSRTVIVVSGTCYYGLGEKFLEEHLQALPAGSFFTEPAGIPHFTWAKEGDVILQTTAIGPSGTQIVPDSSQQSHEH